MTRLRSWPLPPSLAANRDLHGMPRGSEEAIAAAERVVYECLFRMLMPREIAAGMAFAADYVWRPDRQRKISDRNLVKMAGNAVTPPAARDLVGAIVAAQS